MPMDKLIKLILTEVMISSKQSSVAKNIALGYHLGLMSELSAYMYPFEEGRYRPYAHYPHTDWEGGLPETARTVTGEYRTPGFDIGDMIRQVATPAVEIGGPSTGGYYFLRDVALQCEPLNMNIRGSYGHEKGARSLVGDNRFVLHALADARSLPIYENKLELLLASGMVLPEEEKECADMRELQAAIQAVYEEVNELLALGNTDALEHHRAPRIALIAQARRILKPGGLFVMNGLGSYEVQLGRALDMEVVAHTPLISQFVAHDNVTRERLDEVVFRKAILNLKQN
jgi:SAM-dependent methyltransferase